MNVVKESIVFRSLGDDLAGVLFTPPTDQPAPALIVCHGTGDFKENFFELCEWVAAKGIACLAVDMHGHGQSGGERFHVDMREWVPDVLAALDFLSRQPRIDANKLGAFGFSSGGTAILEAAVKDSRLKTLVVLDATVRDSLPWHLAWPLKGLILAGKLKRMVTGRDLRLPLLKMSGELHFASDPEVDQRIHADPRAQAASAAFPFPGAADSFFVDTIKRVSSISIPTLVIWGEDDTLDPPETARLLDQALTCKKQLRIIPGNGHVGHLDRNKQTVFNITADWALENLA